jgi:hypothetical protein
MAKKRKGRRSTRGHDEKKTIRFRETIVRIPIDHEGNPISRKPAAPPSAKTPMAQAFTAVEEQCKPPAEAIKDNPSHVKKHLAPVIGTIGVKKNPEHIPYQTKEQRQASRKNKALSTAPPVTKQCSLNYNVEKEKSFYEKLAFKAKLGTIYLPEGELVARQQARLKMLESGEHNAAEIARKRDAKAKRRLINEHMDLIKSNSDVSDFYGGSTAIRKRDHETNVLIKEHAEICKRVADSNVVQTTTPSEVGKCGVFKTSTLGKTGRNRKESKGVLGIVQIMSAARNDPSWVPDDATAGWYAHNVKPEDWPEDIIEHIQAYVQDEAKPTVIGSGEQYRRTVLMNSYEQQLSNLQQQVKDLERENSYLAEEKAMISDENNFLMWEVCVNKGEYPYAAPPKGNMPTPPLPELREQFKSYMTLHRSDAVKNFLRVSGYNANDSERLKTYNAQCRATLKLVREEANALRRIGVKGKACSLNYKRAQYTKYLHKLGVDHAKRQAVRDVGSLVHNRAVIHKWNNRSTNKTEVNYARVINKQYSFKPTHQRAAYVRWWEKQEAALNMQYLLTKPVNKAASELIKLGKNVKKVLLMDVNPYTVNKRKKAEEAKAARKAEIKAKRQAAKLQRKSKADERQRIRQAMRLAH